MKSALHFILLIFILISKPSLSQRIDNKEKTTKIKVLPDSVYWAAFYLMDKYEYITTSRDGTKFYNSKEVLSRNRDIIKIKEMVYSPEFTTIHSKKYKNVIIDEIVEFDCKNRSFRILKIEYRHDFVNLFENIDNPDGKFRNITKSSIWEALLEYSCDLKNTSISSINEPKRKSGNIIKSKDGIDLGDKTDFMDACTSSGKNGMINIKGIEIDINKFCSCVCDNLFPQLNSEEILELQNSKSVNSFLESDKCWSVLKDCLIPNTKYEDDYKLEFSKKELPMLKKRITKDCVSELLKNNEIKELTPALAENYCSCMVNKLYSSGYNFKELSELSDENGKVYNEILITCMNDALAQSGLGSNKKPSVILGDASSSKISLIDYFGKGYKIKISIDGLVKYFLFDTGASDILIDKDTERELLLNGSLKRENYINKTQYVLANNQIVNAQVVLINNIKIGDYTVNNVKVAILDDGNLLCGKSFLDKFTKWEIDKVNKQLILYK